ncbi:cupin domain-containing protein [Bowmanella denitrificans]|uniref:Cupin domain-containing protein n=1 Tax=Bowmanella denitrificans TaxID=366582 RepID=A0ABN0XTX9_9ALTE
MSPSKEQLISQFALKPHPEGGYYAEVYRSAQSLNSPVHGQPRPSLTHIYFLLGQGDVSRFHRVAHDEVWNHYAGAPLRLIDLHNQQIQELRLGPDEPHFAQVIEGGHYQAAESLGEYSLMGCSVAPGFDFADFNFIQADSALSNFIHNQHPELLRFL